MKINSIYLESIHRPGLVYQYAFDWLAVQLQAANGSAACIAPSIFQSVELLRRLPALPLIQPLPNGLDQVSSILGLERVQTDSFSRERFQAIAWVEPTQTDLGRLDEIQQTLLPDGYLYLIVNGMLARFLAERRQGTQTKYAGERELLQVLSRQGFRSVDRLGLHGLKAVAWHYAAVGSERAGRLHWRDRCHFSMRREFVSRSRSPLVALICLVMQRAA